MWIWVHRLGGRSEGVMRQSRNFKVCRDEGIPKRKQLNGTPAEAEGEHNSTSATVSACNSKKPSLLMLSSCVASMEGQSWQLAQEA